MFGDIFKELTDTLDELRHGSPTRTITVAKPYCSPARHLVTGALQPYGVRIYDLHEYTKRVGIRAALQQYGLDPKAFDQGERKFDTLPLAQVCEVKVAEKAAAWAEYLLLRTQQLWIVGKHINQRNAEWAAKHQGVMPPAWADGKPMIETGCSKGMEAWGPLRAAAKAQKQGGKRGQK